MNSYAKSSKRKTDLLEMSINGVNDVVVAALLCRVNSVNSMLCTIDYSELASAQQIKRSGYPESFHVGVPLQFHQVTYFPIYPQAPIARLFRHFLCAACSMHRTLLHILGFERRRPHSGCLLRRQSVIL